MTRFKFALLSLACGLLLALAACDGGRTQTLPPTLPPPTAIQAQNLPTLAFPTETPMKPATLTPSPAPTAPVAPSATSQPAATPRGSGPQGVTPSANTLAFPTPTRTPNVMATRTLVAFPTATPTRPIVAYSLGIPACKTNSNVNLRSAPNLTATVITVVPGDRWVWPVNWWEDGPGWTHVVIADGRHGYVANDLVDCQFVTPGVSPAEALPTEAAERTLEQLRSVTPTSPTPVPGVRPTLRPGIVVTLRPDVPILMVTPTPRPLRIFTTPGPILIDPNLPRLLPTPTRPPSGIRTQPGPVIVDPNLPRLLTPRP